jgi:hypothetical protein
VGGGQPEDGGDPEDGEACEEEAQGDGQDGDPAGGGAGAGRQDEAHGVAIAETLEVGGEGLHVPMVPGERRVSAIFPAGEQREREGEEGKAGGLGDGGGFG